MDIDKKEEMLLKRLAQIKSLEEEVTRREKAIKKKEDAKKQVLLRLAPSLWKEVASWAEDDFRSINGQIEYILTVAIKKRFKT
jgi:hypothetical protein